MRLQLTSAPQVAAAKQHEELGRFLKFAKQFTVVFAHVGAPYRKNPQTICLVEAPDTFAEQATKVLRVLTQRDEAVVPTTMELKPRQEWTSVHEFQSAANAQPLDGGLIANAASASLKVRYTPNGATATLRCSEQDTELAQQIEALGWTPRPSGFKRLLPRASASVPAQLDWTPLTSNNAVADTQPEAPAQDSAPTPPTSSPLLAAPGEQGFLLGVATDGSAVQRY
jgi:hypothetical protein